MKKQYRIVDVGNGILNITTANLHEVVSENVFSANTSQLNNDGSIKLHPVTQASITNVTAGCMIIDSADSNKLKFHDGTAWRTVSFV